LRCLAALKGDERAKKVKAAIDLLRKASAS
jgi:hypothetical protein